MSRLLNILLHRKLRNSRFLVRTALILGFLVAMTLLMPKNFRLQFQYEVGKPWTEEDLKAPFDFSIFKPEDSIQVERERVAQEVLDIYTVDSTAMNRSREQAIRALSVFVQQLEAFQDPATDSAAKAKLQLEYFSLKYPGFSPAEGQINLSSNWLARMESLLSQQIDQIYQRGYIRLFRPDTAMDFVAQRISPGEETYRSVGSMLRFPSNFKAFLEGQKLTLSLADQLVLSQTLATEMAPNLIFSSILTQETRRQRQSMVSPIYSKISEGDLIITKGSVVDKETDAILQSLVREYETRSGPENRFLIFLSQFLIILLITGLLLIYLSTHRPRIYFSNSKLSLIFFTFLVAIAAMVIATKLTDIAVKLSDLLGPNVNLSYIYLAPSCIVPIFISNFFDHRTGWLCNLLAGLFGAVLIQQGLEFAFVQIIAGTVAVYGMRQLRKRDHFFFTLGYIFLAYSVSYICFNLLSKGSFEAINYNTLLLFVINVAFTVIAYNLIYLFERLFGVTSDLTYLELLDTNHPLLRELARKAPGTFQHSLQVANIAEATIKSLGGHALLTHVGALYHDIGKMSNSKYFIENMAEDKSQNPHNQLKPEESADIILGHVPKGVDIAQKYHLPKEIIHFIETHHGSTRVEFFYRAWLNQENLAFPEGEARFRYEGPKPDSKETAVLMLSDSIEAASRALKNPTPEKLRELVNTIVDHKIQDNQLENSNLTFKDISSIRKVISRQLLNIYHGRIEYPEEATAPVKPS
ncbi:HDIG domain-containing metalloprotein [Pontibacter sp. G13]|uniref:HD family phosphohydrolase n=1 Tax=Pontibacter sp. G13 TaxID=3074898 RepID=UPI00288B91D4|nr:HDIG domain-containing metalloprotein [Pontibacter sp. G13]WNJ19333.1 HDIG domain-containing protein [Pontibacter sp. G13]